VIVMTQTRENPPVGAGGLGNAFLGRNSPDNAQKPAHVQEKIATGAGSAVRDERAAW
jgi:hypothetical protein